MWQKNSSNRWNLEAVFRTGISPDFSGDFRLSYIDKKKKLIGSRQKSPKTFRLKILLPYSIDFWSFPAENDFYAFTCVQSYFISIHVLHFFFLLFIRAFLDVHISHGSNIMCTTDEYCYNTKAFFSKILSHREKVELVLIYDCKTYRLYRRDGLV